MTTWGDIKRSETPWNWRATLKNFCVTPQQLADFINRKIEESKMTPEMRPDSNEEIVDMDEISIVEDTTTIVETSDEPDSSVEDTTAEEVEDEDNQD